ncbi:hypothetical protein G6Z94_09430 [Vibrio aestuarianus]|uniref:hypothetical protein n=1 Tax=Vibrio aestuarianus TaxID=28171 RepID=UPI0015930138|nr:hypothetical protein [Vibrio aestuarianus]NGZ17565.1 hypothetical protein [Vibrio aestuarianus]
MSEILVELGKLTQAAQEQTSASNTLAQEVSGKMAEIDQKVDAATTVVRDTIRDYNFEIFYVNSETGDNNNDGRHSSRAWRDVSPLVNLMVHGKSYKVNIGTGQVVEMPVSLHHSFGRIQFFSDYSNRATLKMKAINQNGIGDGTVDFNGENLLLSFFGVNLETATQPENNTGKSTQYGSSALSRPHSGSNFNIELYCAKIIVKDFPLIRTGHQNAGFVALSLGYSGGIVIGEGNETHLTYSNDHFGLCNGASSSIDNKNGANTWNAIMSGVGGNNNVIADFDFEAQT